MAYDLPYLDQSFDRIVSSLVIHHLDGESKQRAFRECWRVLAPGGRLHIVDFGVQRTALMRFLASLGVPLPRAFASAAELVLNGRLRRELERDRPDSARVLELISQARDFGVTLEGEGLGFALQQTLERLAGQLHERPDDLPLLQALVETTDLVLLLPFEVRLWEVQNLYWELRAVAGERRARAAGPGDAGARSWLSALRKLGDALNVAPESR